MSRIIKILIYIVAIGGGAVAELPGQLDRISLAGSWRFAMDTLDAGEAGRWFAGDLAGTVQLPGSMTENGKGMPVSMETPWTGGIREPEWHLDPAYAPFHDPGNIRFPFWLQPESYYVGAAWYQRDILVPPQWKGKTLELLLERCHWESRVWLDEQEIGMRNSLTTPHRYLMEDVDPGPHRLTICVDNRVKDIGATSNDKAGGTEPRASASPARTVPAWATMATRPPVAAPSSPDATRAHRSAKLSPPGGRW